MGQGDSKLVVGKFKCRNTHMVGKNNLTTNDMLKKIKQFFFALNLAMKIILILFVSFRQKLELQLSEDETIRKNRSRLYTSRAIT